MKTNLLIRGGLVILAFVAMTEVSNNTFAASAPIVECDYSTKFGSSGSFQVVGTFSSSDSYSEIASLIPDSKPYDQNSPFLVAQIRAYFQRRSTAYVDPDTFVLNVCATDSVGWGDCGLPASGDPYGTREVDLLRNSKVDISLTNDGVSIRCVSKL